MEFFMTMIAPELVIVGAVIFLFVYGARYKDPAD
ncbi:cytochrome bd oxidase small subunit CydS [Paenibacillus haidiansis]